MPGEPKLSGRLFAECWCTADRPYNVGVSTRERQRRDRSLQTDPIKTPRRTEVRRGVFSLFRRQSRFLERSYSLEVSTRAVRWHKITEASARVMLLSPLNRYSASPVSTPERYQR